MSSWANTTCFLSASGPRGLVSAVGDRNEGLNALWPIMSWGQPGYQFMTSSWSFGFHGVQNVCTYFTVTTVRSRIMKHAYAYAVHSTLRSHCQVLLYLYCSQISIILLSLQNYCYFVISKTLVYGEIQLKSCSNNQ